jgi:hypothetical protein
MPLGSGLAKPAGNTAAPPVGVTGAGLVAVLDAISRGPPFAAVNTYTGISFVSGCTASWRKGVEEEVGEETLHRPENLRDDDFYV